jgi:hypothetical protein
VSCKCIAKYLGADFGVDLSLHPISKVVTLADGLACISDPDISFLNLGGNARITEAFEKFLAQGRLTKDTTIWFNCSVRRIMAEKFWPDATKEFAHAWRRFYTNIFVEPNMPFGFYDAIQCRQGDFFSGYKMCPTDIRCDPNMVFDLLKLIKIDAAPVYVTGDTPSVITILRNYVPQAFGSCSRPVHIASPDNSDSLSIRSTIVDHQWLCGAKTIYAMSYSGFSVTAAKIGGGRLIRVCKDGLKHEDISEYD